MKNAKYLTPVLFAVVLGGCVNEEQVVPLSAEYDEPIPVVTELEPEEPGDPVPDDPTPDDGACREMSRTSTDAVVFGDVSVTSPADMDLLGEVVVITGNFDVAVDDVVDLASLSHIRCIGGDVHIKSGGAFSLDDLPALEYIGGAFVVDEDQR